jgi:hypothetical protein
MPYLNLDDLEQVLAEGFNKNNKSLYLHLHLQAFPLNEVDLNCPRCVEKMYSRLVNFKNKEMAKKKEVDNNVYKFKPEYAGQIVHVIGYGVVDTTKITEQEIKTLANLGFKFLFDVEQN